LRTKGGLPQLDSNHGSDNRWILEPERGKFQEETNEFENFLDVFKLGEQIFLLLEYVGEKYERKTYSVGPPPDFNKSEWLKAKPTLPVAFPNLPYYIEGKTSFPFILDIFVVQVM